MAMFYLLGHRLTKPGHSAQNHRRNPPLGNPCISRLTPMLGTLLCERRITEPELRGLGEDKVKAIRSLAKVLTEDAA